VEDAVPDFRTVLSGSIAVEGAFTKAGRAVFEDRVTRGTWSAADEACVMAGGTDAPKGSLDRRTTVKQLRSRYYRQYANAWRGFLADMRVGRYRGPIDAAKRLEVLSGIGSPMLEVLRMVARNTDFTSEAADGVQPLAEGPLGSASDVTKLFQPVLFTTPAGSDFLVNEHNAQYVDALRYLGTRLNILARSSTAQSSTTILDVRDALARAKSAHASLADRFADFRNEGLNKQVAEFLAQPIRLAEGIIPR